MYHIKSHEETFVDLSLDLNTTRLLSEVLTNYLSNIGVRQILSEPRRYELERIRDSLNGFL